MKIAKLNSGFPKELSKNIPLETLVNFYHRYWNGEFQILKVILLHLDNFLKNTKKDLNLYLKNKI